MLIATPSVLDDVPASPSALSCLASASLGRLVREIDAALDGSASERATALRTAIQRAALHRDWLSPEHLAPQSDCYARHLIHADQRGRYTVLSLVWSPGQFSPVHAHHTWCAYAVCAGMLTENLYRHEAETGTATLLRTAVRHAGYGGTAEAGLEQIHRLGNAGNEIAVSLHVYGVEASRISTGVNRVIERVG